MRKKTLKLYRGISADEFMLPTASVLAGHRLAWRKILERRANGDPSYPSDLNRSITLLRETQRLEYQYFTDSPAIAGDYAKKVGGILVEVTVPLDDVLKHFDLEFQNFGRRNTRFEIVYGVKGSALQRHAKKWKLSHRKRR